MRPRTAILVLALLAAALAPSASASETIGGQARGVAAPTLAGFGRIHIAEGAIELSGAASEGLQISWSSAQGHSTTQRGSVTAGTYYEGADEENASVAWPAGTLASFRCVAGCVVRLSVTGGGVIALAGGIAGAAGAAGRGEPFVEEVSTPGPTVRFATRIERSWLVAHAQADAPGYALAAGVVGASGTALLELWNVTATRTWSADREAIATGVWVTPRPGPLGASLQDDVVVRRLVVELSDVKVVASPGSNAALFGPTLDIDLDGSAEWPAAEGHVTIRGRMTPFHGRSVLLRGPSLVLAIATDGPPGASALATPPTEASFAGGAESVQVGGQELVASAPELPRVAAGAVGALGLVGILWLLFRSGACAGLYARITNAAVLTHPRRLAAYESIMARPGIHVSELSRETGVGRVVLQYHLQMLEKRRLVTSRTMGRVRVYYPAGPSIADGDARALAALKDGSRSRVLAEVLASPGGLTQKDLVERTGFSQRLVSYHLARLEGAMLVHGEGARPRRFRAGARTPPPQSALMER